MRARTSAKSAIKAAAWCRAGGLALACLWLAAGCAAPAPPQGGQPAAERLSGRPTIVSLNPCLDAILVAIAPPQQLLALSHYSRDPASSSLSPAARARFAFGGGTVEEVLAAAPDLVLASTFIDPATRNAFTRLGIRVETFGAPATVEQSIAQVREVARLTGNVAAGERLAAAMAEAASGDPAARPIPTLLWQPGQIVPGEATLIADLLRRHGFANFAAARGLGQADYVALETLLAAPPELLLVAGDSAGQTHPLLKRLAGTRAEAFAGNLINCGGPSVIAASTRLRAIRAGLQ
jgi:iron complex transport system substrate-binding protein